MVQPLITPFKITVVTLSCTLSVGQAMWNVTRVHLTHHLRDTSCALALPTRELKKSKRLHKLHKITKQDLDLGKYFWEYFVGQTQSS